MTGQTAAQDPNEQFELFDAPGSLGLIELGSISGTGRLCARQKAHADGLWHRSVGVWLFNSKGRVLLQKRSPEKDTFPSRLDISVGGHIDGLNGCPFDALKRECYEELSLDITSLSPSFVCVVAEETSGKTGQGLSFTDREFKYIYACLIDESIFEIKPNLAEVSGILWQHYSQALDPTRPSDDLYVPRSVHERIAVIQFIEKSLRGAP